MANPIFVPDEVVTAAKMNQLPKGAVDYAQVTSNQGTFTTETDLTGLAVTVDVEAGHLIRITGFIRLASSVAGDRTRVNIKEGSTGLNTSLLSVGGANLGETLMVVAVVAPSAGSHTYKLSASRANGSGNITMQADADIPSFILVEDIGADPNA